MASIPNPGITGTRVLPISKDVSESGHSGEEVIDRCKLASVYRLMDVYGWTNGIWNHITCRSSSNRDNFLMNPLGLLYKEITAGSLVKVDLEGKVIDAGNTVFGFNNAGFILHAPIYEARPDVNCVIHCHVPSIIAVSTLKEGLLPLTQDSMIAGEVSYHSYEGVFVDGSEKELIAKNLGPVNKIMLLRSHGVVVCGSTVEEAFDLMVTVANACEEQVKMMSMAKLDDFVKPSDDAIACARNNPDSDKFNSASQRWGRGELEFEAEMRALDFQGYQTGYPYKLKSIRMETKNGQDEPKESKQSSRKPTKSAKAASKRSSEPEPVTNGAGRKRSRRGNN